MKKRKVLIIAPQVLPIPATKGGAVESLLTDFILYNETQNRLQLYVVSSWDKNAGKIKYNNCSFFYFKKFKIRTLIFYCCFFVWKIIRKMFYRKESVNYNVFGFYVNILAHKLRPDIVMSDGYDKITRLWQISNFIGPERCFYHLHYSKNENLYERCLFQNSICVSNFVLNRWCTTKREKGNNRVVYNGIDLKRFSNETINAKKLNQLREELNIKFDDFVAVFVGRFRPGKGLVELLKAYSLIKRENFKLIIVGDFFRNSFDETKFENEVVSLIDSNRSVIRVGKISQDFLPYYYALADIQIIPSTCEEAAGLVAIEGMSFGLPIIATKSGGLVEYISPECSIQIENDKKLPQNLAKAIERLYLDTNLREKMSNAARERCKIFSREKYCHDLMNCLCENLDAR